MLMTTEPKPIASREMQALAEWREASAPTVDLRWHVLLTEPSCERRARDHLRDVLKLDPYMPAETVKQTRTARTIWGASRRQIVVERPIFRGYLFVPLNVAWSFGLDRVPGLRQQPFLLSDGWPVTLSAVAIEKLRLIEYALAHPGEPILPFKVGDRVRLVEGAFQSLVAEVARIDSEQRIELLMDILGGRSSVFVKAFQIEPLQ